MTDASTRNQLPPRGALTGIRVLDFGRFIAGPGCAAILGDLGADVIRVDKRGGSEDRTTVPITGFGEGTTFIQNNRNKRAIELDPTTAEGAEVVRRLVERSDVVIANMVPATLAQMRSTIRLCPRSARTSSI